MTRFHSQETIAAPLDQVVRWHSLPGAVTRLSPHWAQTVVAEGNPNAPGTRTSMKIAAPGSRGSVRVPWKSEHFSLDDPGVAPLAAHSQNADPQQNSPTALTGSAFGFGDLMVDSPLAPLRSWEHRHVFRSAGHRHLGRGRCHRRAPRAALLTDTKLGSRIGS